MPTEDLDTTHRLWRAGARLESNPRVVIDDLIRKVGRVLELHVKHEHPARSLDQVCDEHVKLGIDTWRHWPALEACPRCVTSTYAICRHCVCPEDRWPCQTYLAIFPEQASDTRWAVE